MQEIWRNSWVVWVGGAWVAVWFEEVGGGWVITWFSGGTEGDQPLPTEMKGRLLEIDRQLTSNKGGWERGFIRI